MTTTWASQERRRIKKIVEAHADYDERGNRSLCDSIIDEINSGSEVRTPAVTASLYEQGREAGRLSVGSMIEKYADHDERGNRVLCDSILDGIANAG